MAAAITLLLVDDEVLITDMLHDALSDGGFSVIIANDGQQALELLDDPANQLAGLITDINMGLGTDGWAVARRARELDGDLPVVYITGGAASEWASQGVPKSILVPKPFATVQILTAIATLLNAPGVA